jgi:endoglucanase
VTVKNVSWNGTIAAGASTTFGLTGTGSSTPAPAPTCTSP